jgi:surface protein
MILTVNTEPSVAVTGGSATVTDNLDGTYSITSKDNLTSFEITNTPARALITEALLVKIPPTLANCKMWFCTTMTTFTVDASCDTSTMTNFTNMFYSNEALTSVANLDTSGGTDFSSMFNGCITFNGNVDWLDTSNVTNNGLSSLFSGCSIFNQPVPLLSCGTAFSMSSMFHNCFTFNQNLDHLDTSNITGMYFVIRDCNSFTHDLSGWNTDNVTDWRSSFEGCTSITELKINVLGNGSKVGLFQNMTGLVKICGTIDTTQSVLSTVNMFANTPALTNPTALEIADLTDGVDGAVVVTTCP